MPKKKKNTTSTKPRKAVKKTPISNFRTKAPPGKASEKALVKFDPLQRYLSEISRYRLLTREEEKELGMRVQEDGDPDAAYVLVTSNPFPTT